MKRKVVVFLIVCVVTFLHGVATAQGLSIFAKQKVVIWDIFDRNDLPLLDSFKRMIYQGVVDNCTNSDRYEVYNVNIEDVKRQIKDRGLQANFPNICKMIDQTADYIIFAEVETSQSAVGSQDVNIHVSMSLFRIKTASKVLSAHENAAASEQSIMSAISRAMATLGISSTTQRQSSQQPSYKQPVQPAYQQPSYSQTPQNYVEQANCGLDMKMVYVEGGAFQMGATSEQSGEAENDEFPVHNVQLDSFYIAECEVTQAQWQKIMGNNPSRYKNNTYPVHMINWEEAQMFCRKLSALTGKTYLLPTEAQWEYAARGGKSSRKYKYSGSDDIDAVAWYTSKNCRSTQSVKQKRANEIGLYDMSGNVWEWCSDWYGEYSSSMQNNPTGASSGQYRVLRGGGWVFGAQNCRVSRRGCHNPSNRFSRGGFRVVCLP